MGFPNNYHTINVSAETKERLIQLKGDDTFDTVIRNLLELEDKYNTITETYEYELILKGSESKLFRVTYSDKVEIEYWNSRTYEFEKNIEAWFTGYRISQRDLDNFIKFIIKDSNLMVLYEMEKELVLNGIWIKRV